MRIDSIDNRGIDILHTSTNEHNYTGNDAVAVATFTKRKMYVCLQQVKRIQKVAEM